MEIKRCDEYTWIDGSNVQMQKPPRRGAEGHPMLVHERSVAAMKEGDKLGLGR